MDRMGGVILAGGASRRMGEDKARMLWDGRRAVDQLADLLAGLGLAPVLVSGADLGLPFVADPSPGAGPVAGLKRALAALAAQGCEAALVVAVDAPTLLEEDLAPLIAAAPPGATYADLPLPMALSIAAAPRDLAGDAPLKRFAAAAGLSALPCPADAGARIRGANTPEERAALMTLTPPRRPAPSD
jgi:molybdenum cofactor guanylyltransferase